jgi:hypothetical protein
MEIMTLQKSVITFDKKIVGSNLNINYGFDIVRNIEPCIEISRGGKATSCIVYFNEFQSLQADRQLLCCLLKDQSCDKAVFKYGNLKLVFFKGNKNGKIKIKLVNLKNCYIHCDEILKNHLFLSVDDFSAILKHNRTIINTFEKHAGMVDYIRQCHHINNTAMYQLFGQSDTVRKLKVVEHCNKIILKNTFKVSAKKFSNMVVKYKQILPLIMQVYVFDSGVMYI